MDPILTAGELARSIDIDDFCLIDCRPDPDAYARGHLPDARHAQLERDLSSVVVDARWGGRHPLPELATFARTLGALGVRPDSRVVVYDDQGGANAAARLWWMLRAVGHARVQVLDGGLAAWLASGGTLTNAPATAAPTPPYPALPWQLPVADIDEVERARASEQRRVIDVRAPFRYRGESEPIDPVAGHIPGARNLPLSENLDAEGRFKSAAQLRALYEAALDGVAPAQTIVHCGSGVTACHSLLALERAGLSGAKLYVGSWSEWCRQPERPRSPSSPAPEQ